jgi:hypothetical protein
MAILIYDLEAVNELTTVTRRHLQGECASSDGASVSSDLRRILTYTGDAMRVALLTALAANKKEPLVEMMNRVRQAFLDAGLGEPSIRFNFGDSPVPGFVSSVDRVLKRYPELKRFVTEAEPMP